jgi:hypothetical protein
MIKFFSKFFFEKVFKFLKKQVVMYFFQFYKCNITRALITNKFYKGALKIFSKPQKIIWHIFGKTFKSKKIIKNPQKNLI